MLRSRDTTGTIDGPVVSPNEAGAWRPPGAPPAHPGQPADTLVSNDASVPNTSLPTLGADAAPPSVVTPSSTTAAAPSGTPPTLESFLRNLSSKTVPGHTVSPENVKAKYQQALASPIPSAVGVALLKIAKNEYGGVHVEDTIVDACAAAIAASNSATVEQRLLKAQCHFSDAFAKALSCGNLAEAERRYARLGPAMKNDRGGRKCGTATYDANTGKRIGEQFCVVTGQSGAGKSLFAAVGLRQELSTRGAEFKHCGESFTMCTTLSEVTGGTRMDIIGPFCDKVRSVIQQNITEVAGAVYDPSGPPLKLLLHLFIDEAGVQPDLFGSPPESGRRHLHKGPCGSVVRNVPHGAAIA